MHELIEKREPKEEKPMKIIKRNGAEVVFDIDKIIMAVTKANDAVDEKVRMTRCRSREFPRASRSPARKWAAARP